MNDLFDEFEFEPDADRSEADAPETPAEPEWKQELRARFESWLTELDSPPDDAEASDETGAPDLYTFHADLTALAAEFRKSNRRSAEAMKQWSGLMEGFQNELGRVAKRLTETPVDDAPPATHWSDLIDLADRLERVAAAFETPPKAAWLARDQHWRQAWQRQREAFDILAGHLRGLLRRAGLSRIETLGLPLDVTAMTVVETETSRDLPAESVVREIRPGYRRNDRVLRLAEVTVAVPPNPS